MGTELTDADAFEMLDGLNLDQYAGVGNENITSDDVQIPYINILQKLSPQVDEDTEAYIEGAKAGMLYQNVNNLLWSEALPVIPVTFDRKIVEWVPREKGGGLIDVHQLNILKEIEHQPNDRGVPVRSDNGNLLVDTATHVVLYRNEMYGSDGDWEPAIIAMKSSNHKKSRLWNSLIAQQKLPNGGQAPRWLYTWNMSTIKEVKDDNSWYNFEFERGSMVDKNAFLRAESLYKASKAGLVKGAEMTEDEVPF